MTTGSHPDTFIRSQSAYDQHVLIRKLCETTLFIHSLLSLQGTVNRDMYWNCVELAAVVTVAVDY